ncbi:hypothetical protein NDU88_006170 [Pleurodeles waltl]|uniref:Uncharacterized protein n=1 Tax=Pleurodeles waltl TaxID=8319 RepID=A0AAV7NPH0_PLEWA|nr:hypothetical protein NDU88_006170 [Pleurodeles waltl]
MDLRTRARSCFTHKQSPPSACRTLSQAICHPGGGSHPGAWQRPSLGPRAQPEPLNPYQQRKRPLAQCTARTSMVRQAGGRERLSQALGCRSGAPTLGPPGALPWGQGGAPEPEVAEEASPDLVDSQAWTPQGTLEEGSACPRAQLGPGRGSLNTAPRGGLLGPSPRRAPIPGPAGAPRLGPEGEASQACLTSRHGTQVYGRMEEGSARLRAQGPGRGSLNTSTQGRTPRTPSQVPCHMVGWRTKPRMGAPTLWPAGDLAWGPAGAPELKLEGEASPGLADSQARAPQLQQAEGRERLPQGPAGAWDPIGAL